MEDNMGDTRSLDHSTGEFVLKPYMSGLQLRNL